MPRKPLLVIVPGIGDDIDIYRLFARRWQRFGYEVHIIPFGWADHRALLQSRIEAFLQRLDELGGVPLRLIGVSAGGTVAIHALALRKNVLKIVTISAPLATMPHLQNPLLAQSIALAKNHLEAMSLERKQAVLSAYGLYDQVVTPALSRPKGIRAIRIYMVVHAPVIFMALMLQTRRIHAFLKNPSRYL